MARRKFNFGSRENPGKPLPKELELLPKYLEMEQAGERSIAQDVFKFVYRANEEVEARIEEGYSLDQIGADCLRIYRRAEFYLTFFTTDEIWPDGPLVGQIADAYEDYLNRKLGRIQLTERQKKNIKALIRTLLIIPPAPMFFFTAADGEWSSHMCHFDIDEEKYVSRVEKELFYLAKRDGLVLVETDDRSGSKIVVWGVRFENGEIQKLSPEETHAVARESPMPCENPSFVFCEAPILFAGPS